MNDKSEGVHIDWTRTIAGALAAVASAVLLSTLGAVGTIIGAAVGSIVVTIASALFTQGLSSSKRSLAKAQASAKQKVGIAHAEVRRAERADDTEAQQGTWSTPTSGSRRRTRTWTRPRWLPRP